MTRVCPSARGPSTAGDGSPRPGLAHRDQISQRVQRPVVHHLVGDDVVVTVIRYRVAVFVASLDATSGSVIAKPEQMRPSSSGSSHWCAERPCRTCAELPYSPCPDTSNSASGDLDGPAGDFGDVGVVGSGETVRGIGALGQEEVPQPLRSRDFLELLDDRRQMVLPCR